MQKLILIFALFLLAGCGGVPRTHYYHLIAGQPLTVAPETDAPPVILELGRITADAPYREDRIVYRSSLHEVQYYHYRRWVTPPQKLVSDYLQEQLQLAGQFSLSDAQTPAAADLILTARIKAFEEWDEENTWFGHVRIAFTLRSKVSGAVVWKGDYSEKTVAEGRRPLEVVRAINESLHRVTQRALAEMSNGPAGED